MDDIKQKRLHENQFQTQYPSAHAWRGRATDQRTGAIGQAVSTSAKVSVAVDNKLGANSFIGAQTTAKTMPKLGQLSFGSGSSSSRVAGENFKLLAGTCVLNIPCKSKMPAVTDLLGGEIDMAITDMATGLLQVKAGKHKALGVYTKHRSPLAPDVPTLEDAGVKGYEMTYWVAAYVPAAIRAGLVGKHHEMLVTAARSNGTAGFHHPTSTPAELEAFHAAESLSGPRHQGGGHQTEIRQRVTAFRRVQTDRSA